MSATTLPGESVTVAALRPAFARASRRALLKVDKELSFGERQMLDKARGFLLKELSLTTSTSELSQQDDVRDIFGL
jgi:RNA polymerase-interacting CarD/CdnL/TRCF family regulator